MTEAFKKWYDKMILREFGVPAHKLGRKRDRHLLRVFVQEVKDDVSKKGLIESGYADYGLAFLRKFREFGLDVETQP